MRALCNPAYCSARSRSFRLLAVKLGAVVGEWSSCGGRTCYEKWSRPTRSCKSHSRDTAVCSLDVQTHTTKCLQIIPSGAIMFVLALRTGQETLIDGFPIRRRTKKKKMIDGSCVSEFFFCFCFAVCLPFRHILSAFALHSLTLVSPDLGGLPARAST